MNAWLSPPPHLHLPIRRVDFWRVSLQRTAVETRRFWHILSAAEQERAAKFYFEKDRQAFVVGRGMLRLLLGRYLALDPRAVAFEYGEFGKPTLGSATELQFNVSHSQGKMLLGFCWETAVGVDIEQIRTYQAMSDIAHRYFSAVEYAQFLTVSPEQVPEAFFNCWTRKEAYIKAIGEGLSCPLDEFDVSLLPGEPARLIRIRGSEAAAAAWTLFSFTPFAGYRGAAVIAGRDWQPAFYDGDAFAG